MLIEESHSDSPLTVSFPTSLGICYDHVNNQIWTSCEDCVEEWKNSGTLSYHHVLQKLSPKTRGMVSALVKTPD